MMLQEAEQYKVQCERAIEGFAGYFREPSNVYVIRREHRKKDIDPEAENEVFIDDLSHPVINNSDKGSGNTLQGK